MTRDTSPVYLNTLISHYSNTKSKPTFILEALLDLGWKQAIKIELEALVTNGTWSFVPLKDDMTVVRCKWVF